MKGMQLSSGKNVNSVSNFFPKKKKKKGARPFSSIPHQEKIKLFQKVRFSVKFILIPV